MSAPARRGDVFRYESFRIEPDQGLLTCRYSLDGREFEERVTLAPGQRWQTPAAQAAARLVFLLAGVSYYKTAAPPVIELGDTALTDLERDFLRAFYLDGLAEFAYRNSIDLSALRIHAPTVSAAAMSTTSLWQRCSSDYSVATTMHSPIPLPGSDSVEGIAKFQEKSGGEDGESGPVSGDDAVGGGEAGLRALVPFGGGIDSIVTVEMVRQRVDVALFVVSRPGDRFDAIERPAAVTGLPVVRAEREIDPQLLRSAELGFLNGHVPVTGIISAIAVLAAVLEDRDAVVMSNEWSASIPTLYDAGRPVNHQYSKSAAFEAAFRDVLAGSAAPMPEYFSALRHRTELWIAERFAALEGYHDSFGSCNRAFHIDKARRLDHWCGRCDKCCFIDLILAPFLAAADLERIFGGSEPLGDPALADRFRALLGTADISKPFECVGEVNECRAATLLAARRVDRADAKLLQELAVEVSGLPDAPSTDGLLRPAGPHFIPAAYAPEDLLG